MCAAPKLCGCRVNMTYFIKNHKSLIQNEGQMPWKCLGRFECKYDDCNAFLCKSLFELEKVHLKWKKSVSNGLLA